MIYYSNILLCFVKSFSHMQLQSDCFMISKTHLTVNSSVLDFNIFSVSKYFTTLHDTLLNFIKNLYVICISEIYVLFLPFEQRIASSRIIMTASILDYNYHILL